jgi:septum site-determining protein MinC
MLKASEMGQLRNQISEREVILWAVLSNSPTTERTAQTLGLETHLARPKPEPAAQDTRYQDGDPAILVHRTLRSGYSLQNSGHVIILGDVNPGAQIISGGDVIVWGHLRGMVHAGAGGNENAVICALDLAPTQLRIAGEIAITPQRRGKTLPEMARIVNGQVIAEPWNPKKRE